MFIVFNFVSNPFIEFGGGIDFQTAGNLVCFSLFPCCVAIKQINKVSENFCLIFKYQKGMKQSKMKIV